MYLDIKLSSIFLLIEDFHTFFFSSIIQFAENFHMILFLPHFSLWKISALFFFFNISVCGKFPHFSFPFTFQFAEYFKTFLFLPHFSLWKISMLFFSFHSSDCRRFLRRLNRPNKLHMWFVFKAKWRHPLINPVLW